MADARRAGLNRSSRANKSAKNASPHAGRVC
jgi:hypothetical protein